MKSNMPKTKELHLCFSSQTATHDPIDIDGEAVVTDDHAVDGCNSRGGGHYHTLSIRIWVCAAGKGMVFKPFSLV